VETGSGLRTMAATATVLVALSVGGCNRDAEGTETASPTGSATASTSTSPTPTPSPSSSLPTVGEVYRQARTAALAAPSRLWASIFPRLKST